MIVYLGIDLGSTTSKAIVIDELGKIVGRGITNTRSDYNVAADIARMDAEFDSRFSLLRQKVAAANGKLDKWAEVFDLLENRFNYLQFRSRFENLATAMLDHAEKAADSKYELVPKLKEVLPRVGDSIRDRFMKGEVSSTSEFFRDLFSAEYMKSIEQYDRAAFDQLVAVYDRSINPVENQMVKFDFAELME